MRISAKGRYGLAAMITLAQESTQDLCTPVIVIAEKLGLSKIYLEQVFALLKRGKLVTSIKGAQGGYRLSRPAPQINAYEILTAVEQVLFEPTEDSVSEAAHLVEATMRECVFDFLDDQLRSALESVTLAQLVKSLEQRSLDGPFMFFV
ncbi:RrF2 family transcriptional regulator [Eubacterium aggregans]|uniref:RrF2 family transcriptional regulator n=1 Tax=Eubacterium aggregans TaxID=81409 RepID=UPI003F2FA38B